MTLEAGLCPDGHVSYPPHPRCPTCGRHQDDFVDLAERTGEVVTWTRSTATPPGVREPNVLAIVEFELDDVANGGTVRALGQVTTDDVATGDAVEPRYETELRDPEAGIRDSESQDWDGYRFEPV